MPSGTNVPPDQAKVLLELAYLTTAVDGRLDDEELASYQELASKLRGSTTTSADLDSLLDEFGGVTEPEEIGERIRTIAPSLAPEHRDLSFKLAVGLSVADLDASENESDLLVLLAETFGFDEAKVEELTAEVYAGLDAGED